VDTTALVWDVAALCKQQSEIELDGTLMASLWTDLAGNNTSKAYQGIGKFARTAASADFLAERLQPVSAPDAARIARLIADLDSEQYEGRQQASGELARLGELVEPELKMALERKPSLEVTRRIDELLRNLNGPIGNGEILRQLRAIEALEASGTPAARAALAKLANGAAGARLTREARAALARLPSR
jgi:hypothetical protein